MSIFRLRCISLSVTLALGAIAALLPGKQAQAQAQAQAEIFACDDSDRFCLDRAYHAACTVRGSTPATCEALREDTEVLWSQSRSHSAGELAALLYLQLADTTDEDSLAAQYRERARAIALAVIASDPRARDAYLTLASLDFEDLAMRVHWLRQVVAIEPTRLHVESLASALLQELTRESYLEAIELYESQYAALEPGTDKWRSAETLHLTMRVRSPQPAKPANLEHLLTRVRLDSDWNRVVSVLAAPLSYPEEVATALETACSLTQLFGPSTCLDGIERTVFAARNGPRSHAQVLADAAAGGINSGPRTGMIVSEQLAAARQENARWLEEFAEFDLDSIAVLDAIGQNPVLRDRWIEVRQEIVRRIPDDGEARFQLAKVYYDRDRFGEAIREFEQARTLLPEDRWDHIDSYLQSARAEVAAAFSRP